MSRQGKLDFTKMDFTLDNPTPTAEELQGRREFYERMAELRARQPESPGPFSTVEEMIREDRDR